MLLRVQETLCTCATQCAHWRISRCVWGKCRGCAS